ncbi:MAG: GYD domain-containing protein [Gammaproteobacteria bacterium]|nr:GYD domain-containing protein [Gammaproteobacteria bacterium]
MATYISLLSFTDQGVRNIKDSPDRYGAFRAMAEKLGVTVKSFHYTVGRYDMVVVVEGNDEAVTTALLKAASLGNVRSETLRAFSVDETKRIIGNIPK